MTETNSNICIINLQNGIGTSSPQISRFTHNFDSIKFITNNNFSNYTVMIITAIDGKVGIVTEGEMLEKNYDSESGDTTILWYPQREVTASDGVVVYQIAAYDADAGKSVWYSKEGRLIVTDSIDTTDLSTEIIGSTPNLITQLLIQLKKLEQNDETSAKNINTNQANIAYNANSIASLNDEFNLYKQDVHKGEEVYDANSKLAQSGKAVAQAVAAIVNSAPETLNTLEELAAALGDDPNFATTVMTLIGNKTENRIFENAIGELQEDSIIHKSNQLNPHGVTKEQVGLENVDNTADIDKPVSDATKTELNKKVDKEAGFGAVAVEPYFDSESDEEDPYTWDKVNLINKVYDDFENQTIERTATVYSAYGADKRFVEKVEGKGLSANDFTDDYKQLIETNDSMISYLNGEVTVANEKIDNKVDKVENYGLINIDDHYDIRYGFEVNIPGLYDLRFNGIDTPAGREVVTICNRNYVHESINPTPIAVIPTTLESNQQYNFGEVENLSLTFPTVANDGDVIYLTFYSGAAPTTLTIDTTNTSDIEVIPESNTGYEIFGKFNGSIWIVNYSEYTVSEV